MVLGFRQDHNRHDIYNSVQKSEKMEEKFVRHNIIT